MTTSIDERQLTATAGQRLRAYTSEYRRAKHYRALRTTIGLVLAFAGPILGLVGSLGPYVAAAAGGWAIIGRLVLRPAEQQHVGTAVRMQELFDTEVLALPWSNGTAGRRPSEEDLAAAARRVETDDKLTEAFEQGWYPSTSPLPHPVDVIVAQLASVTWGRRQHRGYAHLVELATGTLAVAAIVIGIAADMLLADWLITFMLPAMPALLDVIDISLAHRQMSRQKADIEEQLTDLWNRALAGPDPVTVDDCRDVQDKAFKLRSVGLQIPQWYYRRARTSDEVTMREAAAARRREYLAAHAPNPATGPANATG